PAPTLLFGDRTRRIACCPRATRYERSKRLPRAGQQPSPPRMRDPSIGTVQENDLSNPLFSLEGRTALVTGSSRGLGLAIATGLAEAGASLVLNGVNSKRLQESVVALQGRGFSVTGSAFD